MSHVFVAMSGGVDLSLIHISALGGYLAPALVGLVELFSLTPLLPADRLGFILAAALSGWGEMCIRDSYEIAGRMRWKIRSRSWADFPLEQKFFAVGEALAHLDYLEVRGRVCRQEEHGKRRYYLPE